MEYPIKFLPQGKTVKVRSGSSVLRAAREAKVLIATRCGGNAGCLMCKVEVVKGYEVSLTPPSDAEHHKLGPLLDQGIRLACQANICGSVEIKIPEDPLKAAIRKQLEKQKEQDDIW